MPGLSNLFAAVRFRAGSFTKTALTVHKTLSNTNMSNITAIIERASDGGFTVYSPSVKGVYAPAPTEAEAKAEFEEMLEEQAEDIQERTGEMPAWYSNGKPEIEYTYSLSGFFEAFPFINATKFGEAIGINASLMRRYKSGKSGISNKQKLLIQSKFESIVNDLQSVRF